MLGGQRGGADLGVADDDDVGIAAQGPDGVGQALALGHGGIPHFVDGDDRSAQPLHGGHERGRRAGRGLIEQVGQDLALEQIERADPLDHGPHLVGHAEDVFQVGPAELFDREDVFPVPGRHLVVAEGQIGTLGFGRHGTSLSEGKGNYSPRPRGCQSAPTDAKRTGRRVIIFGRTVPALSIVRRFG